MRRSVVPASVAVAIVGALAFVGCTDDTSTPGGTDLPGIDDGTDDGTDEGYLDTMLPASTDPQFTAAPNPDAGRDGAPSPVP